MISFLTPLFLIGMVSAAIPLIIHLSRSRRTKKMRFSTTRFFTDQFLRSYRMSRLKEVLLLLCRMAVCALLAMAFARPLMLPKGQPFLPGGDRSIVLVIDNSASMGYTENGRTLLDRARDSARELLDGLRPNDTASIVLAGRLAGGPEVIFPEPTPERGDVVRVLSGLKVAALGTDLTAAVARAEEVVRASAAPGKEVYVFSDLQETGWQAPSERTIARDGSDVHFFFVRVRPKAVTNVAITAVQYAAARPLVGVPFSIRPQLTSQGGLARSFDVRLFVYNKDGKPEKVGERHVEQLHDGRWAFPRFYHTFTTGGWHAGYVEVQDEALTLDDRRYFSFEVLDTVNVLAVNGARSAIPRLDELFFLKAALTAGPEGKSPIQITELLPPTLASTDLAHFPLVILANVESLSPDDVTKLEAFVDRGGSLLIFLGDKVKPAFYNRDLAAASRLHGGLLPGQLLRVEGKPVDVEKQRDDKKAAENIVFIGDVNYDHPALAAFQDPKFANLTGVTFQALWGIEPDPTAAVLMRTNTGTPLLCEKAFGKGRVLLFTSTCDRDWTNFPVRPAFLPWAHRLVAYLAQEPLGRQGFHATGDWIALPVSATEGIAQVQVKKPDGTLGYAVMSNDPENPLVFTDTAQPGIYTLIMPGKKEAPVVEQGAGKKTEPLFAVNLESYESKLVYLDDVLASPSESGTAPAQERVAKMEAGLKELLPGRPLLTYVEDASQLADVSLAARRGIKLWDIVLAVVLVLALFEPWLANRISLRHYARPAEVPAEAKAGRSGRVTPRREPQAEGTREVTSP